MTTTEARASVGLPALLGPDALPTLAEYKASHATTVAAAANATAGDPAPES